MPMATIDAASTGASLIPAPYTGQFIRVKGCNLTLSGGGTIKLMSGANVILEGVSPLNLNANIIQAADCDPATALTATFSGTLTGSILYVVKGLPNPALLQGH